MKNLYHSKKRIMGVQMEPLKHRLDALLAVLKSCSGETCRHPWKVLHPSGDVKTLRDALKPEYNEFYKNLPKVEFKHCMRHYDPQNELPASSVFPGNHKSQHARHLEEWMHMG